MSTCTDCGGSLHIMTDAGWTRCGCSKDDRDTSRLMLAGVPSGSWERTWDGLGSEFPGMDKTTAALRRVAHAAASGPLKKVVGVVRGDDLYRRMVVGLVARDVVLADRLVATTRLDGIVDAEFDPKAKRWLSSLDRVGLLWIQADHSRVHVHNQTVMTRFCQGRLDRGLGTLVTAENHWRDLRRALGSSVILLDDRRITLTIDLGRSP